MRYVNAASPNVHVGTDAFIPLRESVGGMTVASGVVPAGTPHPVWAACKRVLHVLNIGLMVVAFACMTLLLSGCWAQSMGYRRYPADGKFINLYYPGDRYQRILTQCVGAHRGANVTTLWVEVGGGMCSLFA